MKITTAVILLCCLSMLSSCIKDDVNPASGIPNVYMPLELLRNEYIGQDIKLTENVMKGAHSINGVIISDTASGNFAPNEIIVQNYGRGVIRGMKLVMEDGARATVSAGDSVEINMMGATLMKVNNGLQVSGVKVASIKKLASGIVPAVQPVSISTFAKGLGGYEYTMVSVSVEIQRSSGDVYAGDKQVNPLSGVRVFLHTLPGAVFANAALPGRATIKAIPSWIKRDTDTVMALSLRGLNEVSPILSVVLAGWQFGNPSTAGTEITSRATSVVVNLDTPVLSRGQGYNPAGLVRSFASSVPVLITTRQEAETLKGYYEFTMHVKPGFVVSFDGIQARLRRSAAGANVYRWTYSKDNVNFTNIGPSDISFTSTADGVDQAPVILSDITGLQKITSAQTITFRLYGWGFGSLNAGSFAFARYAAQITTNCLEISGIVDAE